MKEGDGKTQKKPMEVCGLFFSTVESHWTIHLEPPRNEQNLLPRKVLMKIRRLKPLSTDTHRPLVEGHCQGY